MLLNEKINDLQKLTKKKISYEKVAKVLGLGSKQAAQNRVTRKQELKDWEILALDEAFLTSKVNNDNQEHYVSIDYYPDVLASCGNGTYEMSQECIKYNVPATLFPPSTDVKSYSMCHAKGNSMYPRIWDGDFVICEHKDNMKIENGEMYIFCFDDQIYLKRLTKNINQIVVESENPDFPTQYIEKDQMNDVHLIGHVICSGRMNGKYLDKRI